MPDKLRKKLKREWVAPVENISGINPEKSPREFIRYFKAEYNDSKIADRFYSKVLKEIYKEAILVPEKHKTKSEKTTIEIQRGFDLDDRQSCLDDFILKLAVLTIFKNYQAIKNYKIKVKRLTVIGHSSDPDTLYLANLIYIPTDFITYYENSLKNSLAENLKKEPDYNSDRAILSWGGIYHNFHKNDKTGFGAKLFEHLWMNWRKVVISGEIRTEGRAIAKETVMFNIGMAESPGMALRPENIKKRKRFETLIKNINKKVLKKKKFPIKIERRGGIQIVVKI